MRLNCLALAKFIVLSLPACGQILTLIPNCGPAGTKVCVTGSGWAEPLPVCRYTFAFEGTTVAPDQPDGLFGPPRTAFNVPAAADGDHPVRVQLRLNSPDNLLQEKTELFRVTTNAASSATTDTTGTYAGRAAIKITFTPGTPMKPPCKKIVFVQTIRRFARKTGDTDAQAKITKASDWTCLPDRANKDTVETTDRRRVDQVWAVTNPYYFAQGTTPDCDAGFHRTGCLCRPKPSIAAQMLDAPDTPGSCYPTIDGVATDKAILRFEVNVFCAEGEPFGGTSEGEYLGKTITWEHHQLKNQAGTIQNAAVANSAPSADFLAAVAKWITAKGFALPQPKPSPCP